MPSGRTARQTHLLVAAEKIIHQMVNDFLGTYVKASGRKINCRLRVTETGIARSDRER
jgi:hypothetical protein